MAPRLSAIALAALVALASGCVTPSIPIPPPEPEKMSFGVDAQNGTAIFTYEPRPIYADAIVYIYNRDLGSGIITTARPDGSVGPTDPFPAQVGHNVTITFEADEAIASTCVVITATGQASPFCTH